MKVWNGIMRKFLTKYELYDIAEAGCRAQSLVLGSTNMAKLNPTEIAIATNKGWTVS